MHTEDEVKDWAQQELDKQAALREEYCAGLEALAQFLRSNPQFKLPEQREFIEYVWNKEPVVEFAKALGHADKKYSEYYLTVSKSFGPILYGMRVSRETVCERVVTGTKKVAARAAYMVPAEPEHEEEIVTWKCNPLLADGEI